MNNNTNDNLAHAKAAYQAWEKGEKSGDYTEFKKLVSPQFDLFSHPTAVRGVYKLGDAYALLQELVSSREKTPNKLTFSNPIFMAAQGQVAVQFDSEGTVMGMYPYKGYNVIVFSFDKDGLVTGFREYFGDVEPSWFQQKN